MPTTTADTIRNALTWSLGYSNPRVAHVQRILIGAGCLAATTPSGYRNDDGIFGKRTRAACQAWLVQQTQHDQLGLRVVRWYEEGGMSLVEGGKFGLRPDGIRPRIIVLHWPAFWGGASRLHRVMSQPDAKVSTHWAVDETGAYQFLDHSARAWHATWTNRISVGVDICQGIVASDEAREKARGLKVEAAVNTTGRGDRRYLTLDPAVRDNARALVMRLCAELDIPLQAPRGADGRVRHDVIATSIPELGDFTGVVGHHHVDRAKWDIAPWWSSLFGGTPLGD